jgi:hypothetical protein
MCTKRVLTAVLTAVALVLPAGLSTAQADPIEDPTGLLASDNIAIHTVLPQPAAIGARFRGNLMYLTSSAGLTIYDISNPISPVEVSRTPLPHFENEDVDLGGDILLISNDAAESYGILYVIDISDPAAPVPYPPYQMGGNPASPIVDIFAPEPEGNPGHTASCILECAFAWVTDAGGMRVIDLREPAAPVRVGNFGTPAAGDLGITHDVQMDENGIAWISGYGGVAGYRIPADYAEGVTGAAAPGGAGVSAYHQSLLVTATDANGHSGYGETFGLDDGSTYNDFILHNSRRLKDSDVVYVTEEDYSRPGCNGAGSFETWRLPMREETDAEGNVTKVITGEPMTPLDKWETELLTDGADNPSGRPQPTAMCSAHYFDVKQNVVAQGWYEQGLRLLDVSDPADIRQVGYFIPPNGESWASYFAPTDPTGRVFYVLDASLGVVVLEYDRPVDGPLAMPAAEPEDEEEEEETDPPPGDEGQGGGAGQESGQGGQSSSTISGSGGSSQGSASEGAQVKKKKSCKERKTKKARRACRKKRQRARAAASKRYEPTVVAPVREEWTTGTPQSAPSRQFGYACRIPV